MNENIVIKNAHLNNLKNINLKLPKNKIIVFCGVSGSGKSTLIFDTIFKEGQKRYIESLSSYARQYLDFYSENKVDQITGLSPAISIDQKTRTLNPRSTVGTLTETTDRLRVLFSKIGKPNQDSSFIFFKKYEEISSFPAFKHLQSLSIFYKPTSKKVVTQLNSEKTLCLKNKKISKQKESEFYLLDSFKVSNSFEKRIQSIKYLCRRDQRFSHLSTEHLH